MQWITDNPVLFAGIVLALVLFIVGLVLALRTQGGRDALAAAAVKLAVFALGLAERWLGKMIEPASVGDSVQDYQQPVTSARADLQVWLNRRS
jgi:hypothetical protein